MIFHSYVKLPEGTNFRCQADFGRQSTLVPDLLKRLATLVMAGEAMTLHGEQETRLFQILVKK